MSDLIAELETRLTRYCAIDSQSDPMSMSQPSSDIQWNMARLLQAELAEIGASDIKLTDYGTVIATVPGSQDGPTIAFLAHMDTAPQFHASGVKPRVIRGYNGGEISFPDNIALKLSPANSAELAKKIGHDIVTASGTTLLGADDKAGIAIIMAAARKLIAEKPAHVTLRLAFTPDEEIGRGVDPRLPKDLAADFAYTFDGSNPGEIEYESFSADGAVVKITGVSAHPGWAKDKMVNAIHLAGQIITALPKNTMQPEVTSGRDGFIHATDMSGGSSEVVIHFILRDFELDGLAQKREMLRKICDAVSATEPRASITCEIKAQYRNMRYWLEKDMTPVELARAAAQAAGLEPVSVPIRGGTDGSRLTELGLPCPNLFTGMQEIHGPLEWVSLQDMAQAVDLMVEIATRAAK